MLKTSNCKNCGASFVPRDISKESCKECSSELDNKSTGREGDVIKKKEVLKNGTTNRSKRRLE